MHLKIALLNPLYNFMVTTNKTNVFWWTPKLDKSKVREQKLKKLYGPFYGCGSTASRLESLFTTKFPEILDTHFINLRRTKG